MPEPEIPYPAQTLARLAERLETCGALWVVGGSTGLAMRGADIGRPPRDLDLYADEEDIPAIHACLADFAADEPQVSVTDRYRSILSHYTIGDTSIELVGSFQVRKDKSFYRTEVRSLLHPLGDSHFIGGSAGCFARLVPLGHELIFNVLRDRPDRCRIAGGLIARDPKRHLPILRTLIERNELSAEDALKIEGYAVGNGCRMQAGEE